ncbi:MAG: bifunctional folylpolyglutamate synthase/dihydrofolate synthase [Candidatus Eremiobacteraeota bacterium]|nr:bifunctional folylpolyglutamate synthase/dihydrofolate synthase [Candidatus Eremiobacteraeota bacterium]
MDFRGACAYLLGTINETVSRRVPYRLERMRAFLRELGDPQDRYPTIHVGGTSGKGSTATMIAAALSAAGKHCGLHTKPHLASMTERARIDGVAISEEAFAETLTDMLPAIARVSSEYSKPSYYETLLALAFVHFASRRVDVAVIEVGLGGTLDGTNVITPKVSIITNVGLDHMDVLGSTVEEIAADKVGIAKAGVPLVSAVRGTARPVIEDGAIRAGAPFLSVDDLVRVLPASGHRYGQAFAVETPAGTYDIRLPVLGLFQQTNAATAILALEQLPDSLRPQRHDVEKGLARVMLPGRMEFFPSHPSVVFDVAHNADKMGQLVASLRETFEGKRFSFVVAIAQSKDARGILSALATLPGSFTFTSFEVPGRAAVKPQRLVSIAEDLGIWGRAVNDPVEALAIARRNADASEVVVITGSTFVVADLRGWWLDNVSSQASA